MLDMMSKEEKLNFALEMFRNGFGVEPKFIDGITGEEIIPEAKLQKCYHCGETDDFYISLDMQTSNDEPYFKAKLCYHCAKAIKDYVNERWLG